eukprot:CFRG7666T1
MQSVIQPFRYAHGKTLWRASGLINQRFYAGRPTVTGVPLNRTAKAPIPRHVDLKMTREALERIKNPNSTVAPPSSWVVVFGWVAMSLSLGAWSMSMDTDPDRSALLLAHPERLRSKLLSKSIELLERELNMIQSCAEFSDDVKALIMHDPVDTEMLLTYCTHPGVTVEARNSAARILEISSRLPQMSKIAVLERGFHQKVVDALNHKDPSLYVQKQLATMLCNFAIHTNIIGEGLSEDESIDEICLALGSAGVVSLLNKCHEHKYLKRRSQETAMERISAACVKASEDPSKTNMKWKKPNDEEWMLMLKYSFLDTEARKSIMYKFKSTIVESGVLMYFHTAAGGLVWGVAESIRAKKPMNEVLKFGLRTSLVTCLVPIYFVGASVTIYNYTRKKCEDSFDVFALNSCSMMSLLPWYYILPKVEKFSPFWIGGHVVGFVSFFCYLLYTNADSLQNDNNLKYRDEQYRRWKARQALTHIVPTAPKDVPTSPSATTSQ